MLKVSLYVTLDELAENFSLSKPYLSKYIREKAGMTFQEVVRKERNSLAETIGVSRDERTALFAGYGKSSAKANQ